MIIMNSLILARYPGLFQYNARFHFVHIPACDSAITRPEIQPP